MPSRLGPQSVPTDCPPVAIQPDPKDPPLKLLFIARLFVPRPTAVNETDPPAHVRLAGTDVYVKLTLQGIGGQAVQGPPQSIPFSP